MLISDPKTIQELAVALDAVMASGDQEEFSQETLEELIIMAQKTINAMYLPDPSPHGAFGYIALLEPVPSSYRREFIAALKTINKHEYRPLFYYRYTQFPPGRSPNNVNHRFSYWHCNTKEEFLRVAEVSTTTWYKLGITEHGEVIYPCLIKELGDPDERLKIFNQAQSFHRYEISWVDQLGDQLEDQGVDPGRIFEFQHQIPNFFPEGLIITTEDVPPGIPPASLSYVDQLWLRTSYEETPRNVLIDVTWSPFRRIFHTIEWM